MTPALTIALIVSAIAFATPLLLAALGELVGEKSGVLNIGLEGMMLVGAWAGAAASFGAHSAVVGLLAAALMGVLFAAIFALLVLTFRTDAIIVGTGINLLALGVTGVFHRAVSMRTGDYSATIAPTWCFAVLGLVVGAALWWGLAKTRKGLQLRAAGEYPDAAETAGVEVLRLRWMSTLFNGALCGVAGAFLSMSQTHSFAENMTSGRGFIALAIVIFGRWNPIGALGAALLFGAAQALQFQLQTTFGIEYYPLLLALPYVLTLATLAGFSGRSRAPLALGQI